MTADPVRQRQQALSAASRSRRTQGEIVSVIAAAGPDGIDTASLARRSGYSRNTIVRQTRTLVDAGFITRRPDPTDTRVIRYRLNGDRP